MVRHWWVNQNQSYDSERREGILWAPFRTADGKSTRSHWNNMDLVSPGDRVLHYAHSRVMAWSAVVSAAIPSRRPDSLPTDMWEQDGRLIRTFYRDATRPVLRDEIPVEWRYGEPEGGAFQVDARVKLGYLFPLSSRFFDSFAERFADRFIELPATGEASFIVPAEAQAGALDLLRRLIGVPLVTVAGRRNVIRSVNPRAVTVATDRSPQGRPVPVADVDAALARLVETGQLVIHPDDAGYRSAFIGAVLSTLPNTLVESSSPPVLRLLPAQVAVAPHEGARDTGDKFTFEGDLSLGVQAEARGEQAFIRRQLFGAATDAACALCGDTYPVRFLWAAHIKRRAACSDEERRDVVNVAMAACVFGCDALYEAGYVTVGEDGHLLSAPVARESAVGARLAALCGRGCSAFTANSATYFAWHRANIWLGSDEALR